MKNKDNDIKDTIQQDFESDDNISENSEVEQGEGITNGDIPSSETKEQNSDVEISHGEGNFDEDIPEEERRLIYEEMEEMLASNDKGEVFEEQFQIKDVKKKFRFPIVVNTIIILLLVGAVSGTYAYFYQSDEKFFITQEKTNFAETVLAQILIDEIKGNIEESQAEIDRIREELDQQKSRQDGIDAQYEEKYNAYKAQIDAEYEKELANIRAELEARGLSPEELERTFAVRQRRLAAERDRKAADFLATQNAERNENKARASQQIAQLQQALNSKESEVNALEENLEVAAKAEPEVIIKEVVVQDDSATKELASLREQQKQRENEIKAIALLYNTVSEQLGQGNYTQAKTSIKTAQDRISKSSYKDDPEIIRISEGLSNMNLVAGTLESFEAASSIVDPNAAKENRELREQLQQEAEERAKLLEEQEKLTEESTLLEEQLQKEIKEKAELEKSLDEREKRLKSLEARSVSLNNVKQESAGKQKNVEKDFAGNVQLITLYLARKKQSLNVSSIEKQVREIVNKNTYYRVIGNIIANSLDPSGNLSL